MRLFGQQQQINKLFDLFWRNLRLILVCLLCGLTIGLAFYLRTPKAYQSTALLMFQQQQISPTKMSPDVQGRIQAMVNTVSQQVTSRTNLEGLIKTHNLYPEMRQTQPIEDVIETMRENISFNNRPGGIFASRSGEGDVFEVSFAGKDPAQVMRVANDLASRFVEENIRFREEQVTETSAYVQDELEIAKSSLDKKEAIMRDYKLKFYNEMPSQRESNIARLNALQDQYQSIQASIQELERTRLLIQEQISLRDQARPGTLPSGPLEVPLTEVEKVRQELDALTNKYTSSHPDVKRLQNRLATLLQDGEEGLAADESNVETAAAAGSSGRGPAANSQTVQLQLQLKEMEIRISRLNADQETIRAQVERVQQWVEAAPIREAEWSALTRDYDQLQQRYETLVARGLEAESAETLEKRQKGSQFKIIEPAHYAEKPFQPNFKKIFLKAALFSLGLGISLAYLLEFMNTSFRDVAEVETYLGLKVNCAIPALRTAREKSRRKLKTIAWTTALTSGFLLLGGSLIILWQKGIIII